MITKLTLSIDREIIEKAKKNFQTKENSLSKIVEDYFKALLAIEKKRAQKTPIVEELSGVATLPKGKSTQDVTADYLLGKYR